MQGGRCAGLFDEGAGGGGGEDLYAGYESADEGGDFPADGSGGASLVWGRLAGGLSRSELADDYFKYVVFENPNWDFKTLNFDSDFAKGWKKDGRVLSAVNPDLRPFFARGGKLIQYHGWTDQQVMPENSINYHESVVKTVGAKQVDASYRLFMVPGMGHCGGGDGPNKFDMLGALDEWKVGGKAPDAVVASHATGGTVDRTRPLCAYPEVAKYKGSGSTDEASNFACVKPGTATHRGAFDTGSHVTLFH